MADDKAFEEMAFKPHESRGDLQVTRHRRSNRSRIYAINTQELAYNWFTWPQGGDCPRSVSKLSVTLFMLLGTFVTWQVNGRDSLQWSEFET